MRTLFAWLGAAMLALALFTTSASADEPLKPYVVLMLDVSGSMDAATGSGPPSCGGEDNRLNHARCAINKIVNSYGDMVFALGKFRQTPGGTFVNSCDANGNGSGAGGDQCTSVGVNCSACNCNGRTTDCTADPDCTADLRSDLRGEMLTGLIDGQNSAAAVWTDFACGTCSQGFATSLASQPEIWGSNGFTPLGGYLSTADRYWRGLQGSDNSTIIWPDGAGTNDGFDPIRNDPKNLQFLPNGCDPSATCTSNCCTEQCRPYITIMLTDGDETCGGNAVPVAQNMLQTVVDGRRYRVETKVIGFGVSAGDPDIEAYAQAGGAPNLPGNEGFYVQNENELQLAISSILDDAIRTETCNDLDDDCDGNVDEDFEPDKGNACDNGAKGVCRRTGTLACKGDGTGLFCNASTAACVNNRLIQNGVDIGPCVETCNNGLDDDCDGKVEEGCVLCSPQQEQCNGRDDDCDGRIDEASTNGPPLTRPCDNGTCPGIETCNFVANCGPLPGTPGCSGFGGCTAQPSTTEICDGIDNNCDGVVDGFQQACSTMNPVDNPFDDPRNNPGHPDNGPINPKNICHPGFKICPANPPGPGPFGFQACGAEVKPCNVATNNNEPVKNIPNGAPQHPNPTCFDQCNGLDDDCDNNVDEDFTPSDCSDNCFTGTTTCINGVFDCDRDPITTDDTCDGVDDDCDGLIDEDYDCDPVAAGQQTTCPCTDAFTCNGIKKCENGSEICEGTPISQESCDCEDNDCDNPTVIDEGAICSNIPGSSTGSICNEFCQCALPASNTENPCPVGKFPTTETKNCLDPAMNPTCDATDTCTQNPANTNCCCRRLCITDPCFDTTTGLPIVCPSQNGDKFVCIVTQPDPVKQPIGTCVRACPENPGDPDPTKCAPNACIPETGQCAPDNCTTFPDRCDAATQNCIAGVCVTNLCVGVTCATDQYCVAGNCVASCADIDCPTGQRCRLGACEPDPCGEPCPTGQACNDNSGECVDNTGCGAPCAAGQYCNPNKNGGTCEDDQCQISEIVCPTGQVCLGGTCFDPSQVMEGEEVRVTTGGGGCTTGTGGAGVLIGLALLLLWRSRRSEGGRS